jgi:hypothetical protein
MDTIHSLNPQRLHAQDILISEMHTQIILTRAGSSHLLYADKEIEFWNYNS